MSYMTSMTSYFPYTSSNFLGILRNFAFLGEQMFVVDGVTVNNASGRG